MNNELMGVRPGTTCVAARIAVMTMVLAACSPPARPQEPYVPRTRTLTVTAVPLLTKELRAVYPFLAKDFGTHGVLQDKEVYAFVPSTLTVVEGDTIAFEFLNPEDDVHSFVLPDFAVLLPPQSITAATYVARRAGLYTFTCSVATHLPSMWGQLVVLSPAAFATEDTVATSRTALRSHTAAATTSTGASP